MQSDVEGVQQEEYSEVSAVLKEQEDTMVETFPKAGLEVVYKITSGTIRQHSNEAAVVWRVDMTGCTLVLVKGVLCVFT